MSMKGQEGMIKAMGKAIGELSETFVHGATSKFLTAIDTILADMEMTDIEKFGAIKVIMDLGWKRITAVTHGDPDLTIDDLAVREAAGAFLTGDKGMDDSLLDVLGLERKDVDK